MLKINLIPASYFQRLRVRRMATVFGAVFGAVVAGLIVWMLMLQSSIAATNEQLSQVEPVAQETERLQTEATGLRSEVQPVRDRIKFIEDTMDYNVAMIPVLAELSKYTYSKITYTSVQISDDGTSLTIQGQAPSTVDFGRYYQNLLRAKHLFSSVAITGPPGYRSGAAGGGGGVEGGAPTTLQPTSRAISFTVNATLRTPITAPAAPGGAPAAGAEGVPGMPPGMAPPPGAAAPPAGVGPAEGEAP